MGALLGTTALAGPLSRALGPVNGSEPLGFPSGWGPQGTGGGIATPDSIPGLRFAIRPDQGVTVSGSSVTVVAPAWGTSVGATGALGTTAPLRATGFGPQGQSLFKFTSSGPQFLSLGSTITVASSCTMVWVYAPGDISATSAIFGSFPGTNYIRTVAVAGNAVTVLGVQTVGGSNVNIPLTAGVRPYRNLLLMALTYDAAQAGGTINVWVNNLLAGTATGVGTGGFAINRVGVYASASTPLDAYLGPQLIYDRSLPESQLTQLTNFFKPWRGQNLYVANSGSDSSLTPWNSTTPLQTVAAAGNLPMLGFETVALKGGDVFRMTSQVVCSIPGLSESERMSWDGAVWGTGKAQLRSSTAPAVSLVSGTVYDCGPFVSKPTHYVHYIPGGVIVFGPNYGLGNMQRLVEDTVSPGTPAVGKWGYTGGNVFVNAGVALVTGDVEVTLSGSVGILNSPVENWNFNNVVIAFPAGTCGNSVASNQTWNGMEAYFGTLDGFDGFAPAVNLAFNRCIAAYCGSGLVGTGSNAGDAFSHHGSSAVFTNCEAWWCDKGGFNHIGDSVVDHYSCVAFGSLPFRLSTGVGGEMTVINCLGGVSVEAVSIDCVRNDSTTNSMTVENCTLISLKSAAAGGSGIIQTLAGGNIRARNNIIVGFAVGLNWRGTGGLVADFNNYFGNTTECTGTTLGPHDILSDPQFTNSGGFNFVLQNSSPALGAGVHIPGIGADLAGVTRSNPPSIGAYEDVQYPAPWMLLENGLGGGIGLESGLGVVELQSAPWP